MTTVPSRNDREKLLVQAIEQNDRHLARRLILKEGVEPVGIDPGHPGFVNLLRIAAESIDVPLLTELLKQKPNLNTTEGSEILQIVIDDVDTKIARMLVRAGAHVEPKYLRQILHRSEEQIELVRLMLDHGVHVHECEGLLRKAILSCSLDFAEELLKRGTGYEDAEAKSNMDKRVWEALCGAISYGEINAIELLVKYGLDVTKKSRAGVYPVYIAASKTCSGATRYLIGKGANIHQANDDEVGRYPIHAACDASSTENIKLLSKLGVDFNVVDKIGRTPFSLLSNGPGINETQKIFIKSLVAQTVRTGVNNSVRLSCKSIEQQNFVRGCTVEAQKMKELKVLDYYSFLHVFCRSIKELSFLVRNANFVDSYRESCRKGEFVIFLDEINENLKNAIDRKDMLINREEALYEAICEFFPDIVIQKIIYYLYLHELSSGSETYITSMENMHLNLQMIRERLYN